MKQLGKGTRLLGAIVLLGLLGGLSACGGGGGGNDGGSTTGGAGGSTSGGSSGGTSGGTTGGTTLSACQQQFSPELAAAGQDCTPIYGRFCPISSGGSAITNDPSVFPCDGVVSTSGTISGGGLSTDYVSVQPSDLSKGKSALYVLLNGTLETGTTVVNRFRMSELAKGRDLTVVAPTAPGAINSWGDSSGSSTAARVALIDALVDQFQGSGGTYSRVIIAGASGGAEAALEYACAHADKVTGVLLDAGAIRPSQANCVPGAPIATVQVHGTKDFISPYGSTSPGILYEGVIPTFQQLSLHNGCQSTDVKSTAIADTVDSSSITGINLDWVKPCAGKGSSLVTIEGGGHEWPGYDGAIDLPVNLFGAVSFGFDTTLQGYDLLTYLGS